MKNKHLPYHLRKPRNGCHTPKGRQRRIIKLANKYGVGYYKSYMQEEFFQLIFDAINRQDYVGRAIEREMQDHPGENHEFAPFGN
jgi:hypothetical protein